MKKILICLIAITLLSNCDIRVKKDLNAQISEYVSEKKFISSDEQGYSGIYIKRVTIDSMQYLIFEASSYSQTPFAINLTKEKLEIELLRKKIKEK